MKPLGSVIAVIPAKGGSRRVQNKNLRELGGKPLVAYPIETALRSALCDEVMVSTEDARVADVARAYGAEVPFYRSSHLAQDPYQAEDVCLHVLDQYAAMGRQFDTLLLMLPTSPFCSVADVRASMRVFREHDGKFLMSVARMDTHYYHALRFLDDTAILSPFFDDDHLHDRVSPMTPVRANGAVTIVDVTAFRAARTYYGTPLLGYEMPWERSIDIDTEADLALAEFMLARRKEGAAR